MSLEIRVLVEVGDSESETTAIRAEQVETVMPVSADGSDVAGHLALIDAAMGRMSEDCLVKAREQVRHISDSLPGSAA